MLEFFDLLQQLLVAAEERVAGIPFPLDEGVPDEQLPRGLRVDAAVVDFALSDDRHAVEGHPLVRHDRAPLLLPVRFAVCAFHEVAGELFHPFGFDAGIDARPQPRRLYQLG